MRHYQNVQAMRGIAAIMVILVHSVALPVHVAIGNIVPFWGAVGPAGVDLFFVISGFIISTVAANAGDNAQDRGAFKIARVFAIKRMARIYPVYWVVFIIASVAAPYVWLSPDSVPHGASWRLFFLIDVNNYRVMAAWTLVYELYFYLVVTLILLVMPRKVFPALFAWAFVTTAVIIILEFIHKQNYVVPLSPLLLEFMLGVGVAYLLRRGIVFSPIGAISTGVFLFAIGAYENNALGPWEPWTRVTSFGPAAALILYGVVAAEMNNGWTFWRPWQKLGDASYSVYIWHQLLFFSFMTMAQKAGITLGPLYVAATIATVVCFGYLSYRYFENPVRWKLEKLASTPLDMGASTVFKFAKKHLPAGVIDLSGAVYSVFNGPAKLRGVGCDGGGSVFPVPIISPMDATLPATTPYLALWARTVAAPIAGALAFGRPDLWISQIMKRRVDPVGRPVLVGLTAAFLVLLWGAAYWGAIENRQAREKLGLVGARVIAALDAKKPDMAAAAESIGLRLDPMILMHIDNVAVRSTSEQFVQGWAGDGGFKGRAVEVLIFQCGAFLGGAAVGEARPDVAAVLRVSRNDFGFYADLPRKQCPQDDLTALVLSQDQHFGLISAPASH